MPRKPSAATPRSETTAELIARISAERDSPVRSRSAAAARRGVGVLDAPVRVPTQRGSTQRGSTRRGSTRRGSALPRQRVVEPRPYSDDVLADPAADDTPTVTFGVVAPVAPHRRGLTHRLLPVALGAAVMIAISVYTANGFALPDFTELGPRVADTGNVLAPEPVPAVQGVPEPGPTGPTVPAPAAGPGPEPGDAGGGAATGPTVPAPVPSGGAPDVALTEAPVLGY